MQTIDLSQIPASNKEEIADIAQRAGVNLKDCYQCGKCSAGCPMVEYMDVLPRMVIRDLQLGLLDEVLKAKTPWVCAGCNVCSTRCPQNIDIAGIMEEVRRASKAAGYDPVPEASKFEEYFLDNVRKYGTSREVTLAMKFNLGTGHLFQDAFNAPTMVFRGILGNGHHKVQNMDAVRMILEKTTPKEGDKA